MTLAENDGRPLVATNTIEDNAPAPTNTDHLSLCALPTGDLHYADTGLAADLPSLELEIDFELLDVGADLLAQEEKSSYETADIDTSGLSLLDND